MTETTGFAEIVGQARLPIPLGGLGAPSIEMRVHELKTWPGPFALISAGRKTFELRWNADRDFAEGDILCLREFDPIRSGFTDREVLRRVTCVLAGPEYEQFGLQHGYALLGLEPVALPRDQQAAHDAHDVTLPRLRAWHGEQAAAALVKAENWRNSAEKADQASKVVPSVQGERFRACQLGADLEARFHQNAAATLVEAESYLRTMLPSAPQPPSPDADVGRPGADPIAEAGR